MKNQMSLYYDKEGDFLEISIGEPTKCYAEEMDNGIFIRKDEKTNEVKSIGILSFKTRTKNLQDVQVELPLEISVKPQIRIKV